MVLLPGTGATADDWDEIAAALCADPCSPRLRHGGSDWPGSYSVVSMADDISAVLPALTATTGARTVDLIGHSLGGLVACRVAAGPDAPVRRLVLEDVGMPHPRTAGPPERPAGQLAYDWAMVQQIRPEIDEPDPAWPQIVASIRAPALVIGGGPASFLPQEHIAELAGALPAATSITIDAGHLIHALRPAEFTAAVRAFLGT